MLPERVVVPSPRSKDESRYVYGKARITRRTQRPECKWLDVRLWQIRLARVVCVRDTVYDSVTTWGILRMCIEIAWNKLYCMH